MESRNVYTFGEAGIPWDLILGYKQDAAANTALCTAWKHPLLEAPLLCHIAQIFVMGLQMNLF